MGNNVSGTVDLERTYSSAVAYLEAQRDTKYELVWLDNGGSAGAHDAFIRRGAQFEAHPRNERNEGLFRAVNDVWFRDRGCRAPYVLSLEDDRLPRPDLLPRRKAFSRADASLAARVAHLAAERHGIAPHRRTPCATRFRHIARQRHIAFAIRGFRQLPQELARRFKGAMHIP